MHTKIKQFIQDNKMLEKCDRVIVGLSGGADSVCLLNVLSDICKDVELIAVHVNHGIRGAEADRDEEFCISLCKSLGVKLAVERINVPQYAENNHLSIEEAARVLRYKVLKNYAGADGRIAVAHHRNDQAETVLFNIIRGTRLKGASGMQPVREGIIRPLLCITREEIENYLKDRKLTYCTDSTNLSNDYARNRIRNEVIPALGKVNNKAMENIAAFAEGVGEAEEYLLGLTLERYKEYCVEEGNGILFKNPEKEHPYMCSRLVRMIIGNTGVGLKDFTGGHIEEILSMLSSNVGAKKHVRNGLYVERRGEGLLFYLKKEVVRTPVMVNPPMEITPWEDAGKFIFSIEDWNNNKKITNEVYTKLFDYDKIKFGLQLRGRMSGDVIGIDDYGHHKRLKQYLIDEKMSGVEKDQLMLLADGDNIVWVIGRRIGSDYKITEHTKRVLKVVYEGGPCGEN